MHPTIVLGNIQAGNRFHRRITSEPWKPASNTSPGQTYLLQDTSDLKQKIEDTSEIEP